MSKDGFEIGYGKPPVQTRFRKGQSGNPAGSSRKTRGKHAKAVSRGGLTDVILEEFARSMRVIDRGQEQDVGTTSVLMRGLINQGAKGSRLASIAALNMLKEAERYDSEAILETYRHWSSYRAQNRSRPLNYPPPPGGPIYPHPADIAINLKSLSVAFLGPVDDNEAPAFLLARLARDYCLVTRQLDLESVRLVDPPETANVASKDRARALLTIAGQLHLGMAPSLGGPSTANDIDQMVSALALAVTRLRGRPKRELQVVRASIVANLDYLVGSLDKNTGVADPLERAASLAGIIRAQS